MGNIEVKRFLRRYEMNEVRIEGLRVQRQELQERVESAGAQQLSDMPKGGRKKTTEDWIAEIDTLDRRIDKLTKRSRELREEIQMAIDTIGDPKLCRVLDLYYIERKTLLEISKEMNYTYRYIIELYHQAMNAVQIGDM